MKYFLSYAAMVISSALLIGACESAVSTNNTANVRNANSNTAVLVNATATPASNSNRMNANTTREEYDRNRADYERENKGDSTIGQGVNDSWLWFKTRTALATTDDLRDSTINVDVSNDVITLRGTVANAAQKASAEKVAKGIEGQKGVKNQLTVSASDSLTNRAVNGSSNNRNSNTR